MKPSPQNRCKIGTLFWRYQHYARQPDRGGVFGPKIGQDPGEGEGSLGTEAKRVLGGQLAFLKRTSRLSGHAFPRIK